MKKHNQLGVINPLLLPLIGTIVIGLALAGVAIWAAAGRQDYKANVDEKIAAAVTIAKTQVATSKDKEFAEEYKKPLTTYTGPDSYGSIRVMYPKTWSAYVDTSSSNDALLDGYFNPGFVPSIESETSVFALRVRVLSTSYKSNLEELANIQKDGKLTVVPYALPKVPKQIGIKATGAIEKDKTGVMIYLPLRDKTLEISTEGNQYLADFENNILPYITFSP